MSSIVPSPADRPNLVSRLIEHMAESFRDPNPILVKELRAIFRTKLFIRFLYLSTGFVGLVVIGMGASVAAGPVPPAQVGQIVFQAFFATALTVICLMAPAYAGASIAGERKQRTYESLILTGMKPWRIIRGKFLAVYGSMFLVLVAQAPAVGIAFLFGGISPWHVVFGYVALLVALAPAVAFGLAVSSRIQSMWIAIVVAFIFFQFLAWPTVSVLTFLGVEPGRDLWGIEMQGPFWFTEALVSHLGEPEAWGLLVALPAYVFGMPVWFFLAAAVAGIRPAAEDRSTPFKTWSTVAAVGLVVAVFGLCATFTGAREAAQGGVGFTIACGVPLLFFALLFMNEPPLPPRLFEERVKSSKLRRVFSLIGPGAAPTLRYSILLIVFTSFGVALAAGLVRHLWFPGFGQHVEYDAALIILALGHAAIGVFTVSLGTWLRVLVRNGLAARALALATLMILGILSFLVAAIVDPDSLDRLSSHIPMPVQIGPFLPSILAVNVADQSMELGAAAIVLIPTVAYSLLAALFWVFVEARVRAARKRDQELRVTREETARTSMPPTPALQRRSNPEFVPHPHEEEVAEEDAAASDTVPEDPDEEPEEAVDEPPRED